MSDAAKATKLVTELSDEVMGKYLTYLTDGQLFGISIAEVVQIVGMQNITQIPEFPSFAKGVINLRGTIIPVIDMRLRLGKVEKEYDERTCIIVTQLDEVSVGFIVDEVDAVTDIDDENISPPPEVFDGSANTYLTGIARHNGKVVLLMSSSKILSDEMVDALTTELVKM